MMLCHTQLDKEGTPPGVGSPAARAEMRRIMEELGHLEEQDRIDKADQDRVDKADWQPPSPEQLTPDDAVAESGSDAEESDGEDWERRQPGVTSTGRAASAYWSVSMSCAPQADG